MFITVSQSSTSPRQLAWQLDRLPCHTGDRLLQTLAVIRKSRRDFKVAFASESASSFCHPLHVTRRHHGAAMQVIAKRRQCTVSSNWTVHNDCLSQKPICRICSGRTYRAVSGESEVLPGAFFTGANSSRRSISSAAKRSVNGNVSKMKSSILIPFGFSGLIMLSDAAS